MHVTVSVPLKGSFVLNARIPERDPSPPGPVSVPLKGSFVLNEELQEQIRQAQAVSVPLKGSFVLNPAERSVNHGYRKNEKLGTRGL